MALPTSGPLSFSMIGAELGVGTPFSLRNISSNAGFGTPDRVSDFYGYGPSCPPYGTFLYSSCKGCEESYHYANGSCGEYSTIVDYNSPNCGCGSNLIPFFINNETNEAFKVCINNEPCCIPAWHDGIDALPAIGDLVYTDSAGTQPLEGFFGGWYGMSNIECDPPFGSFNINSKQPGIVQDVGNCLY